MKKTLLILSVTALSLFINACSQNTNKNKPAGEPLESGIQSKSTQEDSGMKLTKPAELYPEVEQKYSGIRIVVIDKVKEEKLKAEGKKIDDNVLKTITVADVVVPFKKKVELPNTGFIVEVETFYPNFRMGAGKVIKDKDFLKENNPSAKLIIYENQKNVPIWNGWLFQNFPDMHPFEDPKYRLTFVESVKK